MRAAAALLAASRSLDALDDVVRAIGLWSSTAPVDARTRDALGIIGAPRAVLASGDGSLRMLVLELEPGRVSRDELHRLARRLSARAPHVLWLVAFVDSAGERAGIIGWAIEAGTPRIASLLWEPSRVVDSDAETLCALAAVRGSEDALLHARCVEVLGRDALTRRFYRALEAQVNALGASVPGPGDDGRAVALLYVSRLLFLRFLEAKGWLDGDRAFLEARFDACVSRGGGFHRHVLLPLFFGTLNTPACRRAPAARAFGGIPFLNGGLFGRTPLERRTGHWRFSDDLLGSLLGDLFARFRFVAREDAADWSDASVDPEMLGRAFESLMAAGERRAGGVYYTPHELVARVSEQAMSALEPMPLSRLRDVRVLDPACGSGAFLVYALERLARRRQELGDSSDSSAVRRDVLCRSIFGVDRNPTAVWLCELRLWLSVVIENREADPRRVPPLPNLDRNIRVGDALVGTGFAGDLAAHVGTARIVDLRHRYVRATGPRKATLARALDREERRRIAARLAHDLAVAEHQRRALLAAHRSRDLFGDRHPPGPDDKRELTRLRDLLRALKAERRRVADGGALPFSFGASFADAQARGGFDVVVGNPPWVRLHHIPASLRLQLKRSYEVYRCAPWRSGAEGANASAGFASQVDLAALFVERSVSLLRQDGVVALLLPMKLWRSLAGGGLRHHLLQRTRLLRLEDLSESPPAFDAAVYPSLLVARAGAKADACLSVALHSARGVEEWPVATEQLPFDHTPGAPWILLAPDERPAFDALRDAGVPLAHAHLGAPRLGVKSGCNAAFVVRVLDITRDIATIVSADGETGSVEASLLRPALRGESVERWQRKPGDEFIIWTHEAGGAAMRQLPDRARTWLRRHYSDLAGRSDAAHARRWWSLFRVDAADTTSPRVVWADFGRRPRALVLPAGDLAVPLNTCYMMQCADERDAWAFAALLNSDLVARWLNALAEPARGGYRRYLGWTIGQLPIPRDWERARTILSAAARASEVELHHAVLDAYALRSREVVPFRGHR